MIKKRILITLLVVLALSLTACVPDKGNVDPNPGSPPAEGPISEDETLDDNIEDENLEEDSSGVNTPEDSDRMVVYEDIKLTPMDVFDKYMEKYPDTKVKKLELDTDSGSYVYEVEGYDNEKEYEIKIHPVSGDILKEDVDNGTNNSGEITKANVEKVQALIDKTIKEAGEGTKLDEWTLKIRNGKAMLEVEVDSKDNNDIEYTYDVETGELVEKED